MLSKKYRLPTSFFRKIKEDRRRSGLVYHSPLFVAQIFSSEFPYSRYAVVIPVSLFGGSVIRNRVRRKIYEVTRVERLYLVPRIDCVLHPKNIIANVSSSAIAAELKKAIHYE